MKYVIFGCLIVGSSALSIWLGRFFPDSSSAISLGIGIGTGYLGANILTDAPEMRSTPPLPPHAFSNDAKINSH